MWWNTTREHISMRFSCRPLAGLSLYRCVNNWQASALSGRKLPLEQLKMQSTESSQSYNIEHWRCSCLGISALVYLSVHSSCHQSASTFVRLKVLSRWVPLVPDHKPLTTLHEYDTSSACLPKSKFILNEMHMELEKQAEKTDRETRRVEIMHKTSELITFFISLWFATDLPVGLASFSCYKLLNVFFPRLTSLSVQGKYCA